MKKIININFQGQLITIEETAFELLNQYIQSLKEYFKSEADGNEIVNDIESRIAELFGNRLKHGIPCITDEDVESVINTIGKPEEFDTEYGDFENKESQASYSTNSQMPPPPPVEGEKKQLNRNANDKIIAGICSGVAHYLKIDPVFIRLLFVLLFSVLFWVYIILWIVLSPKYLVSNVSKRLYRNPNEKFIAGVCSGLGAYFKIETWIPRLIFLLPVIFKLFGVARIPLFAFSKIFTNLDWGWNINLSFVGLYIVLWIIMPKAVSVKQKLEMMGEEEYLKSIRATVSGSVAQVKNRTETDNVFAGADKNQATYGTEPLQSVDSERSDLNNNNMSPPPPPLIRSTYQSPAPQYSERSGCLNAIVLFLKVVFFGIAGIIAASLMITLFGLIFASAQFLPIESLFVNPGLEHNLLWTSIILSLGVPIVGVIVWIVRRVMNAKSRPFIGFTVAVLWFIGIVVGLTLGYKITKKFSIESLQETDIVLTSPSNNKMYVEMSKYPLDYFSVAPLASKINIDIAGYNDYDLEVLPFFNVEEDSLLFNSIQLRIKTSNDSLFHVKTMSYSFDKSYKMAKANIKEFDFKIEQNDSVLSIPQFFKTPKSQGYRNQFIVIDIFVPSGSKLEVNDDLAEYKRSRTLRVFRRRSVREYNRNNIYDWNSDEDNMLENGEVTETSETRLMNQLDIKL